MPQRIYIMIFYAAEKMCVWLSVRGYVGLVVESMMKLVMRAFVMCRSEIFGSVALLSRCAGCSHATHLDLLHGKVLGVVRKGVILLLLVDVTLYLIGCYLLKHRCARHKRCDVADQCEE